MTTNATTPPPTPDLHALLDEVLSEAVSLVTSGAFTEPRPGQRALAHRVLDTMIASRSIEPEHGKAMVGLAPTGVGKSLAYLSPAFLMAAMHGQRSVVTTESKALQSQLVIKDAPVVAQAVHAVMDRHNVRPATELSAAVLKSWRNYACTKALADTVKATTGEVISDVRDISPAVESLSARSVPPEIDGILVKDPDTLVQLLQWGGEHTGEATASRDDLDFSPGPLWDLASTEPASCLRKRCPFLHACSPTQAREAVGRAAVIVTNHATVAMQATRSIATIFGSRTVGTIHHLIVDECHALPDVVRSSGASEVTASRVFSVANRGARPYSVLPPDMTGMLGDRPNEIVSSAYGPASELGRVLEHRLRGSGATIHIEDDSNPLDEAGFDVQSWAQSVSKLIQADIKTLNNETFEMRAKSYISTLENLMSDVNSVMEQRSGTARWLEHSTYNGKPVYAGKSSPINVGFMLTNNVYVAPVPPSPDGGKYDDDGFPEYLWTGETISGVPTYTPSVSMVSATLARSFPRDVGLDAEIEEFASPFEVAYGASAVYTPAATSELLATIGETGYQGKWKFNTQRHAEWVSGEVVRLVQANDGAALILAATRANGEKYRDALRRALPGIRVYSQWDGSAAAAVKAWRADPSSVLVGVKSLMTGVDAPGQTCSLVIIDRPPRAPKNPVDEARCKVLKDAGIERWSADRMVYVGDASRRLSQAAGRLIRSVSDSGMVAVLDPRLVAGSHAYPKATREAYIEQFAHFPRQIHDAHEAVVWLKQHRLDHPLDA